MGEGWGFAVWVLGLGLIFVVEVGGWRGAPGVRGGVLGARWRPGPELLAWCRCCLVRGPTGGGLVGAAARRVWRAAVVL